MVLTIKEHIALLRIEIPNPNKVFWKKMKGMSFVKKMSQIMGMDMITISQVKTTKGKNECIPWEFLKFLAKCEDEEYAFIIFAIVMYGMVIFPKVLNHIKAAVIELVEQVEHQANHVPIIVVETIRSLNFCRRKGGSQFIGCVQLL